ncbi:MAG TPA: hypothetical protein VGN32_21415 [Ktedonobacterales bacterium]|nr:hypothetical protein [Ktedonobacterales bacterium]
MLRNDKMKTWAIILFVVGHTLALIGGLTLVVGVGLCILPFALIAEAAGFVCLCLI